VGCAKQSTALLQWPKQISISIGIQLHKQFITRAGKNQFESIRLTESIRIDSVRRIELVFFDSVQFDYTIHISDITMFVNWQPIS